ncbi:amine oxidase [Wolfiporia cocos MD-104 SS10]|uniref:Amine oxidase n=1 Tax=Wolfiporia cocos (strain MD-104) TaxID=742152 RepID=A0A2H3K171_WOLCO|nr:amine oxidase [Wolfiporia cocos MD-104 SS10]
MASVGDQPHTLDPVPLRGWWLSNKCGVQLRRATLPQGYTGSWLFQGAYHIISSLQPSYQPRVSWKGVHDTKILILGGGVAGVIAARTLYEQGVSDFIIIEAREELGGRMMSHTFGVEGHQYTVELGANWVQGTQVGAGAGNPIWDLAQKHNITTRANRYHESISTFDATGPVDFKDAFNDSIMDFKRLVLSAGHRAMNRLVDMTARGGYSLIGSRPETPHEQAAEYYQFDWEYGVSPEETSWLAASWAHNYTFSPAAGGFSKDNRLSIDQRGFKRLIQAEAEAFLEPEQLRLNTTVRTVSSSQTGVKVVLDDGTVLSAEYAVCTFSLGALQHGNVRFEPPLPAWKQEAIHSMTMGAYTKIFLQFEEKFWFDSEMALYADIERGRYPVWQNLDHPNLLPGSGILVVTVTGAFSKRIEALSDAQVQAEVLAVLQAMHPGVKVPKPVAFYVPRWGRDPRFRGAYSIWPPAFRSEHHTNLRATIGERLWFASEATSRRYFGFLQGAYTEGESIGSMLAECVKGGGCVGLEHVELVQNAGSYDG